MIFVPISNWSLASSVPRSLHYYNGRICLKMSNTDISIRFLVTGKVVVGSLTVYRVAINLALTYSVTLLGYCQSALRRRWAFEASKLVGIDNTNKLYAYLPRVFTAIGDFLRINYANFVLKCSPTLFVNRVESFRYQHLFFPLANGTSLDDLPALASHLLNSEA